MVVFDNSIFCLLLHPDAKPRAGVDRAKDRVQHLIDTLRNNKEVAIIPAPVLSEFLVFAGKDAPAYLVKIRENSSLRVEPFDERAAIELADLEIAARNRGDKHGSAIGTEWQKVKFDRQIVAIARVHGASVIYSDDPHIAAHGKDCGVQVLALADLDLPPAQQLIIEEVLGADEGAKNEAIEPKPADVSGSGGGHPEGQAGAEGKEAGKE
jgi:predicted nucleic acid-binding protein